MFLPYWTLQRQFALSQTSVSPPLLSWPVGGRGGGLYLQQVFAIQVPFLDAVVPGAAEEHVPLDHQRLDAVVVWRLKVVCWADAAQRALGYIEELEPKENAFLTDSKLQRTTNHLKSRAGLTRRRFRGGTP